MFGLIYASLSLISFFNKIVLSAAVTIIPFWLVMYWCLGVLIGKDKVANASRISPGELLPYAPVH